MKRKLKIITCTPIYFACAFILLTFASCKKYLDKKSNASLVVPTSIADLQALLDNPEYMNYATPMIGEAAADDYYIKDDTYNLLIGRIDADIYKWNRADYFHPNDWSAAYFPIFTSNLCLERIEKIDKTVFNVSDWDNVKGTALFIRSYYFLNLAWAFAKVYDPTTADVDLGIVLRLGADFNVASVRASVKETYAKIISDAKDALNYLPDHALVVMRPSKAAAYGLLARAYLSMRQYDSAGKYANLCLSINHDLLDFNQTSDVQVNSNNPFMKFNKETVFYSEVYNSKIIVPNISSRTLVDTTLYSTYSSNDLRKTAFFMTGLGGMSFKSLYSGSALMFSGIATDEMYLIRAECFARAGKKDEALADLNTLLVKRYTTSGFVPVTAISADAALNLILQERRKELIHRGFSRWIDIKRLNKEGANIIPKRIISGQTYTLPPNSDKYALPLPTDIIQQTDMPQNPGW